MYIMVMRSIIRFTENIHFTENLSQIVFHVFSKHTVQPYLPQYKLFVSRIHLQIIIQTAG